MLNKLGATSSDYSKVTVNHSNTDIDGNTYVVGQYEGKLILGKTEYLDYGGSGFVAKFDNQGNVIWSSTFKFSIKDPYFGIEKIYFDKNGKIYVTGQFEDFVDFGNGIKLTKYSFSRFLAVFGSDGKILWTKDIMVDLVTLDGKIFLFGRSPTGIDVLAFNNTSGLYETTSFKNLWTPSDGYINSFKVFGNIVYFIATIHDFSSGQFNISTGVYKYMTDSNQLETIASIPQYLGGFDNFEVNYNALYILGAFDINNRKRVFGEFTVKSPFDSTYYVPYASGREGGFFVKYDLISKKFEWAKVIKNMSSLGFNNFLVSGNNALYLTTGACCGSLNDLSCYSAKGDSLWTRTFYTDGQNIAEYSGLGVDNNGNVYASGTVSSGGHTATFGDLSFRYEVFAGFLAKIGYPLPTQPQNLIGQAISTSSIKLTWIDGKYETGYNVEGKSSDDASYSLISTLKSNSSQFTATNLDCRKAYS
ncbi:MAG: hypothetical protein ACKO96_14695, partial [Flammeovirgaceae bacterium]